MKHVITLQQAMGRSEPIECALSDWLSGNLVLVFASGIVVLAPKHLCDSDMEIHEVEFDLSDYAADALIQAGIASPQEIDAYKQAKDAETRKQREAYDRRELARLQSVYGGKP